MKCFRTAVAWPPEADYYGAMSKEKSKGHVAFIGEYEYLMIGTALYRATIKHSVVKGTRPCELWVGAPATEFAIRVLRLSVGLPEYP